MTPAFEIPPAEATPSVADMVLTPSISITPEAVLTIVDPLPPAMTRPPKAPLEVKLTIVPAFVILEFGSQMGSGDPFDSLKYIVLVLGIV
jgi:hypothetical protein